MVVDFTRLAGPPRSVPALVRLRVLFGGFVSQFGWVFFGFGLIFVWIFTLNSDLTSWYRFGGNSPKVSGKVTACEKTRFSEGGSKYSKGTPVYKSSYEFTVDGVSYEGASYKAGRQLTAGKAVQIEYVARDPKISRIVGYNRAPMGLFGLMPVIFPLIGGIFVIIGLRSGFKAIRLLRVGLQTTGKLVSKKPTNSRVNNKTVYKLTFEFRTEDGRTAKAMAKTHIPEKLEDEVEEPLVYDPLQPDSAVMLDSLPGNPRIDSTGNITESAPFVGLLSLIIPGVTVVGHGLFVFFRFIR